MPSVKMFKYLHYAAMKHCIAGIYTNYKSTVVYAPDMEQAEGFAGGPRGRKLELRFERI